MIKFDDNREIIFKTLRSIIMNVTGCSDCVEANPNAPAPKGTYATIQIVTETEIRGLGSQKRYYYDDENIVERNVYDAQWRVQVDFWGTGAVTMANSLQNIYYLSSAQELMREKRIGINLVSPVTNTTALQSGNFEERATCVLTVTGTMKIEEVTPIIKSVSLVVENERQDKLATVIIDKETQVS